MVPTRLALTALAKLAHSEMRRDRHSAGHVDRMARFVHRFNELANDHNTVNPREADPAVLGYLTCYLLGHAMAFRDLVIYLERRQEPAGAKLRAMGPVDRQAACLVALGIEE